MGITEILRRIWLFSANKIKSSESFSKQPTQLIIELNSSLRQIIDSKVLRHNYLAPKSAYIYKFKTFWNSKLHNLTNINMYQYFFAGLEEKSCNANVCRNGGTCLSTLTGPKCHCPLQFSGRQCEEEVTVDVPGFVGKFVKY